MRGVFDFFGGAGHFGEPTIRNKDQPHYGHYPRAAGGEEWVQVGVGQATALGFPKTLHQKPPHGGNHKSHHG